MISNCALPRSIIQHCPLPPFKGWEMLQRGVIAMDNTCRWKSLPELNAAGIKGRTLVCAKLHLGRIDEVGSLESHMQWKLHVWFGKGGWLCTEIFTEWHIFVLSSPSAPLLCKWTSQQRGFSCSPPCSMTENLRTKECISTEVHFQGVSSFFATSLYFHTGMPRRASGVRILPHP